MCDYHQEMCRELALKRDIACAPFPSLASSDCVSVQRQVGGLFIAPDVSAWLGKMTPTGDIVTAESLPRLLFAATGVVVNGGRWCGADSLIRIVFSVPRSVLEEAVARIIAFMVSITPNSQTSIDS
jgi:aspartate/methionine/tyrosine aminotransferase